jgi:hypothetical protein
MDGPLYRDPSLSLPLGWGLLCVAGLIDTVMQCLLEHQPDLWKDHHSCEGRGGCSRCAQDFDQAGGSMSRSAPPRPSDATSCRASRALQGPNGEPLTLHRHRVLDVAERKRALAVLIGAATYLRHGALLLAFAAIVGRRGEQQSTKIEAQATSRKTRAHLERW